MALAAFCRPVIFIAVGLCCGPIGVMWTLADGASGLLRSRPLRAGATSAKLNLST